MNISLFVLDIQLSSENTKINRKQLGITPLYIFTLSLGNNMGRNFTIEVVEFSNDLCIVTSFPDIYQFHTFPVFSVAIRFQYFAI